MDFRRYDTTSHQTARPLSSVTLDVPPISFVPNRKSRSGSSSAGVGSHCRLSRPRSSIDLFRGRMDERRFSTPPDSSTTPPRRPRRSTTVRPTSFLDMSEPSRFSLSGAKLLSSTSMEGIKVGKRRVDLEVKIPDGAPSVGRTLNTFFLRPKRRSQESGRSSPPGLFSGESTHSDSSLPPTPRSGSFAIPDLFLDRNMADREIGMAEMDGAQERKEVKKTREQFDYRRNYIPHHTYPKEEVPYMQSYSHVSLHNDYYTYNLLHHLTPAGSPSFHDFGDYPPRDVLDLGGGEGYWAVEAATAWKAAGTVVTAYDIVDLSRPLKKMLDPETTKHVFWVQDNFLKRSLSLPPKSFDFIRIAGLTLAIPRDHWSHLLKEVKRLLRPGGIVEIIDDELFFPSIQPGPTPTPKHARSVKGGRKPNTELEDRRIDDCALKSPRPLPPLPTGDGSPRSNRHYSKKALDPAAEYRQRSLTTRTMETIFQNMLESEYGIATQPHEFLEHELLQVFDGVTVEMKEVGIPKRDLNSNTVDHGGARNSDSGVRPRKSRNSLEDTVFTDFTRPSFVAPKAAKLLQLEAEKSGPYQPSGYVIAPSTFIPCEPEALEMHALHNIHTLLSCKDALGRYFAQQRDESGEPLISDGQFEELVDDYEHFRRRRMNWPRDYPGLNFEEPQSPKPIFGRRELTARSRDSSLDVTAANVYVPNDALIPVRRIRVFVGHKSDPRAMHMR
ncbi:hypothetical protein BDY19DRAFT_75224 [Irpex rosettiformis]|uniref:Uncharacterized protein n=1 Tax=Irpex rosettiformis TaxID=378272 RepID=A0ACB8UL78_9APHY|nr:hypothetical protein BDY19DRAFT_75224 [Irpex rosettiformis]